MTSKRHLFIVFEGGEGSGKTTQARILYGRLCQARQRARMVREPGGTALGERLRTLVAMSRHTLLTSWKGDLLPPTPDSQLAEKDLWLPLLPQTELFLFAAARCQLVSEIIRPCLQREITVICDRYTYSTIAYQGYGRGMDLEFIRRVNEVATQGLEPDLVVLLDIESSRGVDRKRRTGEMSRFEEEELAFHQRVRQGYLKQVEADPSRWFKVDASLPKARVTHLIWERVRGLLGLPPGPAAAARLRTPSPEGDRPTESSPESPGGAGAGGPLLRLFDIAEDMC